MQARAGAVDELIASGRARTTRWAAARTTSRRAREDRGGQLGGRRARPDEGPARRRHRHRPRSRVRRPAVGQPAAPGGEGMIIRILTEGQFDVPDSEMDDLNVLDETLEAAIQAGDQHRIPAALRGAARAGSARRAPRSPPTPSSSPTCCCPTRTRRSPRSGTCSSGDGLIPGRSRAPPPRTPEPSAAAGYHAGRLAAVLRPPPSAIAAHLRNKGGAARSSYSDERVSAQKARR